VTFSQGSWVGEKLVLVKWPPLIMCSPPSARLLSPLICPANLPVLAVECRVLRLGNRNLRP